MEERGGGGTELTTQWTDQPGGKRGGGGGYRDVLLSFTMSNLAMEIMFAPCHTMGTTGPLNMKSTRAGKKARCLCSELILILENPVPAGRGTYIPSNNK
jgi:hypothetical protein